VLPAALLTLVVVAAGTLATYLYDRDMPLPARLGFGAVTGMAVTGLVGFMLANVVGTTAATIVAAAFVLVACSLFVRADIRGRAVADVVSTREAVLRAVSRPGLSSTGPLLYAVAMVALLWIVFDRVVIEEAGTIATGYVNNLGDLPFHIQVTASFAFADNFPPQDPGFAGTGFAYPYLADFVAAQFVSLGATMRDAFFLQNLTLGLALVAILHRFARVLTRSELAALICPVLVLFSGGLGFLALVDDARSSATGLLGVLNALPHDYTIGPQTGYRWGNAITTLFITQRGLLFGLPMALAALSLLWRLIHAPPMELRRAVSVGIVVSTIRARPEALAAGVITGMLPLIHAHSFAVVIGTAFLLGLVFRQWREGRWLPWAVYVVVALAIALPEIWWTTHDSMANSGPFYGFELGWDNGEGNPIIFWLLNTGLFIPLSLGVMLVPFLRTRLPAGLLLFTLPFLVWFIVPNAVLLAPWVWDNIKVLFYWFVGFAPMVSLFIAWLLRDRLPYLRLVGVGVLIALVLAGSLDVWRVVSGQTVYGEFDADGIEMAHLIRDRTPDSALVLHAPTYNTPAFLAGRQSLLGYPGHVWSRGLDYAAREQDIGMIYAGGPEAEGLLASYGVDYVLVSPIEHNQRPGYVNEGFFTRFTEVAAAGDYRLYQIAAP
jgi:hypothetical protein